MIHVNLLPHHMRPIKRTPVPYMISLLIMLGAAFFIASTFLEAQGAISSKQAELDRNQAELDSLKEITQKFQQMQKQKETLVEQIQTIREIVSDRIIWSHQLWNVSRLAIKNCWYDSIKVETKNIPTMVEVLNPQTKETERKLQQVPRQILTIVGYIVQGEDGTLDMGGLLQNFEQDDQWMQLFEWNRSSSDETEFEGYRVRKFTTEYMIRTQQPEGNTS